MKIKFSFLTILVLLIFCITVFNNSCKNKEITPSFYLGTGKYLGEYFPTDEWRECIPEEVGMNSEKFEEIFNYANQEGLSTSGFIIIKDGYIVCESYSGNYTQNSLHTSYSIAKSFTSAIIGIAIDKQLIQNVDDTISLYYPQLLAEGIQAEKKDVTVKHLLTMKAGFEWNEDDYYRDNSTNDIYRMVSQSNNYVNYVLNKPIINIPGTVAHYSSGESMLLSGIIHNVTGENMYNFANKNLFSPIGITNIQWESDPAGHTVGGWGINTTLRNYAKFGYLYLKKGNWDGNQIISQSYIENSVDSLVSGISNYGYQWWIGKGFKSFQGANLPDDIFLGIGIYRQYLIVIHSKKIIIVRTGNDIPTETTQWKTAEFISLVLNADN